MSEQTLIPHSRESEEALLGSVMINPDCYFESCTTVDPDDFYIQRHRWVWEGIQRLAKKQSPIDVLTLTEELETLGTLDEIGGTAYLAGLITAVPNSMHAGRYAELVIDYSTRRKAVDCANKIAKIAYTEGMTSEQVSAGVMEEAIQIASLPGSKERLLSAKQAAENEYDRLTKIAESKQVPGVPTGFADLDSLLKHMRPGDLDIIAGRPGMGKTSFLQCVVRNQCANGKKILVSQVADMDTSGWMERVIAMESEIPLEYIRSGRIPEDQWSVYTHTQETIMNSWLFMIDDTPAMTPDRLHGIARRAQAQMRGLDLIIVDYLQKMGVPHEIAKSGNRVREVGYIAGSLKNLARMLNVPVLAAAQLNRSVEMRGDKRPVLSDLRESGEIENDADIVMFLFDETSKPNVAEVVVAKHRNGPVGIVELAWRPALARLDNLARY